MKTTWISLSDCLKVNLELFDFLIFSLILRLGVSQWHFALRKGQHDISVQFANRVTRFLKIFLKLVMFPGTCNSIMYFNRINLYLIRIYLIFSLWMVAWSPFVVGNGIISSTSDWSFNGIRSYVNLLKGIRHYNRPKGLHLFHIVHDNKWYDTYLVLCC